MEKRASAHAARIPCGEIRIAIAADHVVPRISWMRRIVYSKLRVVKHVERFQPELQRTSLGEWEILRQRKVKVRSAGIAKVISTRISERQSHRRNEKPRITEQWSKGRSSAGITRWPWQRASGKIRIRCWTRDGHNPRIVWAADSVDRASIQYAEWRPCLKDRDSRRLPAIPNLFCNRARLCTAAFRQYIRRIVI